MKLNISKTGFRYCSYSLLLLLSPAVKSFAQTEVEPWGNINGIRVEGQLMKFESMLSVVGNDWSSITSTGKERQQPKFHREGATQLITTNIGSLYFKESVQDLGKGKALVTIELSSKADTAIKGTYFSLLLPANYTNARLQLNGASSSLTAALAGKAAVSNLKSVKLIGHSRQLSISPVNPGALVVKKDSASGNYVLHFPIALGAIKKGQIFNAGFTIETTGIIDRKPAVLALNASVQGPEFAGFGGNFRIQNPKTDPQVIDYSLKNLRVAWSRVEMPWRFWQPAIDTDPIALARSGKLDSNVRKAMVMAQRLQKMNIPVIVSAWSGPNWAIEGKPNFGVTPDGIRGNALNKANTEAIYKSITAYILYLKEAYDVDVAMFSFNESDIGINIRQTGEEHAAFIKGLGGYFASKGLKTKVMLGDNSDANTYEFIYPALKDPGTKPYMGAVSFHSWRGWETATLQKWADAAKTANLPLIVGEGSIDAAAWNYPEIFHEPTYALQEINLYTRLLAICKPLTILQWQLTADYSPLAGGGIFGDNGPLRPTQRFWNLKQLASTPSGVFNMPISVDNEEISAAALGNNATGTYCVQLVNNGTTRQVTITGIPATVKALKVLITDQKRNMTTSKPIAVTQGKAMFMLDTQSFTTLISE
jgi:hypothetical protein